MEPTKEQMFRAYDEAPEVVRRALQPEGLAMLFVDEMADRYKLHVDVAGTIAVLIRDMILGFVSPNGFNLELQKIGVSESTARQILIDLNTKVFIPLRNQVRSGGTAYPSHPPQVQAPQISRPSREPHKEVLSAPTPALASMSDTPSFNLIGAHAPGKTASTQASVPPTYGTPVQPPIPIMRTMNHDMELMQQGSMPAPYSVATPQLRPAQATPARMFQTASVPTTANARPQLAQEPVHIVPDAARTLPSSAPQIAPVKEYTSDPYREPI